MSQKITINNIERMNTAERIMYLANGSRSLALELADTALTNAIAEVAELTARVEWMRTVGIEPDTFTLSMLEGAELDYERVGELYSTLKLAAANEPMFALRFADGSFWAERPHNDRITDVAEADHYTTTSAAWRVAMEFAEVPEIVCAETGESL